MATAQSLAGELDRKLFEATSDLIKRWVTNGSLSSENRTEAIMAIAALDAANAKRRTAPLIPPLKRHERQLADVLRGTLGLPAGQTDDEHVGAQLSAIANEMMTLPAMSPASEAEAAKIFKDFLIRWYEPVDPVISEGTRPIYAEYEIDGAAAADPLMITQAKVQAYYDQRFPERKVRVAHVEPLLGGYSKGTYIVDLEEGGKPARIVLRQDRPGLPTGSSVTEEFPPICDVYARGVLAPEPLWVEGDFTHFGTAVMATGFREGKPGRTFPADEAGRRKWTSSTAQFMASLHNIRPDEPGDMQLFMRRNLDRLRERMDRAWDTPHPGLAFGFAWLERNMHVLEGRPVCRTHGDLAFHNILMKDDEISVVVDWEFTTFSDPSEDISYIVPFLKELGHWDAFLEEYGALTGYPYDPAAMRWFKVYNSVRIAISNLSILHLILNADLNGVALIVAGANLLQKFEIELLDTIIAGPQ